MAEHSIQSSRAPITLWTPRFLLLFSFILISGISAASILTEAQMNNHYQSSLILSGYVIVIFVALTVLTRYTRILWMQTGTLFGYLWAAFSLITFFLPTTGPISLIRIQLLAAASSTLLGFSICMSTHDTPLRRWDTLLFWLAPLLGACIIAVYVLLHPIHSDHMRGLLETTTTVLLASGSGLWWLRPSCWQVQAWPTFLFGLAPLLWIFVSYWAGDTLGTRLFLSQLALLCMLLGILRIIQATRQKRSTFAEIQLNEKADPPSLHSLTSNPPHDEQNQHSADGVVEHVQQYTRPE